jgi:hypothetical protein
MSHNEAVILLTDYVAGRLAAEEHGEVQAHLETCGECTGLVATVLVLKNRLPEEDSDRTPSQEHPKSDDLVDFALDPDSLPESQQRDIAGHLARCAVCTDDVEAVKRTEAATAASPTSDSNSSGMSSGPGWRSLWPRLALAAAAIGAAGTTYLGFYRVPRLQSRLAIVEEELRSREAQTPPAKSPRTAVPSAPDRPPEAGPIDDSSGLVRLQPLPATTRGNGHTPHFTLASGERALYLSVGGDTLDLPDGNERVWRFELVTPNKTVVWLRDVPARDIRRLVSIPQELILSIPTHGLPSGRMSLRLHPVETDDPLIRDIPFILNRQGEPTSQGN